MVPFESSWWMDFLLGDRQYLDGAAGIGSPKMVSRGVVVVGVGSNVVGVGSNVVEVGSKRRFPFRCRCRIVMGGDYFQVPSVEVQVFWNELVVFFQAPLH